MRNMTALVRVLLTAGLTCLPLMPCRAQQAEAAPKPAAESGAARVSLADTAALTAKIKALESPTSRVYLYWRVAAWLSQSAGEDQEVRRAAVEAAVAGLSDLHQHGGEVPPAPAAMLHARLLAVASKHDPQKAEEMKRVFPLRRDAEAGEGDRAAKAFYEATSKLGKPESAAQGAQAAAALIESGGVPASVLLGELMRLDQEKSPALLQLLASALALEERRPGSLPLRTMFFLSHLYLKEDAPAPLRSRFLSASLKATRLGPADLRGDPAAMSGAVSLLQATLPAMQKFAPELYAEASARLASLSAAAPPETAIYERVKNSADPLAQLMTEAESARDERLKAELLSAAAREARKQGKLRRAAELIVSSEDNRRTPPESHAYRDEFLTGVTQDALAASDFETARFAISAIKSPAERAGAWRLLARQQVKADDPQSALRTLGEAQKALEGAPDSRESAAAHLQLAAAFAELDGARASEAAREAAKVAGRLRRLREQTEADFSWKLFPLSDAAVRAFQSLARADRAGALGLANDMQPRELGIAALLGVYSSAPK